MEAKKFPTMPVKLVRSTTKVTWITINMMESKVSQGHGTTSENDTNWRYNDMDMTTKNE